MCCLCSFGPQRWPSCIYSSAAFLLLFTTHFRLHPSLHTICSKNVPFFYPNLTNLAMGYFHDMTRWAADHPGTTIAIAAGGTLVAVPMAVATPVLGLAGFGGQGIAAGA